MQSREFSVVGWNIFLWMVLGLVLSRVLYFVMASLQLIDVCLEIILWTSILAILPMLARLSIHCVCSVGFVGRGGIMMFLIVCRVVMSGLLWRYVWGV